MIAPWKEVFGRIGYLFVENLLVFAAVLVAVGIRFFNSHTQPFIEEMTYYKAFVISSICQISFYYNDLYALRLDKQTRDWLTQFLRSLAVIAILLAVLYYLFPSLIIGRGIFLIALILLPPFVMGWRVGYERLSKMSLLKERILIIGTGTFAKKIGTEILGNHRSQFDIVGFIDSDPKKIGESVINPRVIGDYESLPQLAAKEKIDRVIVALPERRGKLPIHSLMALKFNGTAVNEGVSFYERLMGKILVENLRPSWFVFSAGFNQFRLTKIFKRVFDITAAAGFLVLNVPWFVLLPVLIRWDSPGPVFFRQVRVGEGDVPFTLYKFRSMDVEAEEKTGPVWAGKEDTRVTRIGRILRKSRLDELPQLFNVLRGDMSFVGPRPERPFFVEQLQKVIPYYSIRHTVKPGITGWAQIKYSYGATREDAREKLQFDLFYIKRLSVWFDVMIILETIKVVLLKRGSR